MRREVVKVEGLKEAQAALDEMSKATATNTVRRALLEAGQPMADVAQSLAPDDPETGGYDLSKSVTIGTRLSRRQKKRHKKVSKVEVFVGAGPLSSATQQEFGNARHGPQSFMRPAFDTEKMPTLTRFAKLIWVGIDKVRARVARKAARLAAKS